MNQFKDIFSEHLTDISLAVKLGQRFQKTPYTIAREFAINFSLNSSLARCLLNSLEDKEIYNYLLTF